MNKYIEYDIHNGITLLRCAVMNILNSLDSGEIDKYDFGEDISIELVEKCMKTSSWAILYGVILESGKKSYNWISPSGRTFVFTDKIIVYE